MNNKKEELSKYINNGKVLIAICGGYQLLGKYYTAPSGERIEGLGILDIYTEAGDTRFIGDTVIYNDKTYYSSMVLGDERKGIKLSFITDTRPTFEIPQFIYGSDLFICEGMYGDDLDISKAVKNKHMTFREAASLANAGNVDKLLLTHFSPSIEEPKKIVKKIVKKDL